MTEGKRAGQVGKDRVSGLTEEGSQHHWRGQESLPRMEASPKTVVNLMKTGFLFVLFTAVCQISPVPNIR